MTMTLFPLRRAALLATGLALLTLHVGCSPYPYANIPPLQGDVARHNIDANSIRTIVVPAVKAVVAQEPPDGPYVVELPQSAEKLTYPAILPRIGDNANPPFAEGLPEDAPVYEVTSIRIRGFDGQVDVVRPGSYGGRQLVTVYLRNPPFADWTVQRVRVWRGPVDASPPAPAPSP
ncbi:MAG: hypothetical protein ACOC1G_01850 [Phycisphaeraceae bacterium]